MCQANVLYDCGHTLVVNVGCKSESRKKGGLGNLLKYALFEEPCDYGTEKRRHKLCRSCESKLENMRDYSTRRDKKNVIERGQRHDERLEHRARRHRDDHERTSCRSHDRREHRHHDHHGDHDSRRSGKSSSHRSSNQDSRTESSRSSRHRHRKSSREEERGRSPRPRKPMATIDESAPLPTQELKKDVYSGDVFDASRIGQMQPGRRSVGSSIGDFQDFLRAAERAEAAQNRDGSMPAMAEPAMAGPVSGLDEFPPEPVSSIGTTRPKSSRASGSVFRPARADWKPQPVPEQQSASQYYGYRPPSSVYSQPSLLHIPEPPRRSSKRPQRSIASMYTGAQSDVSWVTEYAKSESSDEESPGQDTAPTSKNTTPRKAPEPMSGNSFADVPRRTIIDPWTVDPFDRLAKEWAEKANEELTVSQEPKEAKEELIIPQEPPIDVVRPPRGSPGPGIAFKPLDPNCSLGKYKNYFHPTHVTDPFHDGDTPPESPPDSLRGISPRRKDDSDSDDPKPAMMHFTCYRDSNNSKKPPTPTPSSTGSQVFMNPRGAPRPPFAPFPAGPAPPVPPLPNNRNDLPLPDPKHNLSPRNSGFAAHRFNNQSQGNLSTVTRWSDMCPPKINTNIKATHNGKPIHVVNPNIVKNSRDNANGQAYQRPSAGKKPSSSSKGWFAKLRPQASEASFGCVDAKKLDSSRSHEQELDSKKSSKSSISKSQKTR